MSATPGPWRVTESVDTLTDGHPIHYGIVAGKQTEKFYGVGKSYIEDELDVVEIDYDRDYNMPMGGILSKDDAYLIAAVHDLRDALEALVKATEERDNPGDMGVFSDGPEMKAAKAAIAKSKVTEAVKVEGSQCVK